MATPAELRLNDNKKTKYEKAKEAEAQRKRVNEHNAKELAAEVAKRKADKEEADRRRAEKQLAKEKAENESLKRKKKARAKYLEKDLTPDEMADYRQIVRMANSNVVPDKEHMSLLADYRIRLANNGIKWAEAEKKMR